MEILEACQLLGVTKATLYAKARELGVFAIKVKGEKSYFEVKDLITIQLNRIDPLRQHLEEQEEILNELGKLQ